MTDHISIIGLTGGICNGKSTVAKTFVNHGYSIVDADLIARKVVEPGTFGLDLLINHFGKQFLNLDGNLNRIALGQLVFSNSNAMLELNMIMSPLIEEEADNQFNNLFKQGIETCIYDAPLICERGHADRYRPLIVVACRPEVQLQRLMKRNGLTQEQAMARISAQLPAAEKIKVADHVIDSNGSIDYSVWQTECLIKELQRL